MTWLEFPGDSGISGWWAWACSMTHGWVESQGWRLANNSWLNAVTAAHPCFVMPRPIPHLWCQCLTLLRAGNVCSLLMNARSSNHCCCWPNVHLICLCFQDYTIAIGGWTMVLWTVVICRPSPGEGKVTFWAIMLLPPAGHNCMCHSLPQILGMNPGKRCNWCYCSFLCHAMSVSHMLCL